MCTAIKSAAQFLGSQAALARALGIKPPTVNQWCLGVRPVPAEKCPEIELATDRRVLCEELRPDVNWGVLTSRADRPMRMSPRSTAKAAKPMVHNLPSDRSTPFGLDRLTGLKTICQS